MKKEEALGKIRESLKKLMSFSETVIAEEVKKFESVTANDGTIISYADGSNLEVGTDVFGQDADGNETPLADGTYELEDGRTLVVANGAVSSIAEGAEANNGEETPMDDAKMDSATPGSPATDTDTPAEEAAEGESSVEDRVTALENTMAEILELLQGMSSAQEMAMSKIQEIAEAPAVESIKVGKTLTNNFSSHNSDMEELREIKKKYNIGNSGYGFNATRSTK